MAAIKESGSDDKLTLESESHNREILLLKGDRDLRGAIANLSQAQSLVFAHSTRYNVSETVRMFEEMEAEINRIGKESANIKKILQKTRILSINASVEAAHVGMAGKGFGVVADEIGSLANQTEGCTNEVEKISQSLFVKSSKSRETLDQLMRGLTTFSDTSVTLLANERATMTVEDNGFILTTLAKRIENHADYMRNVIKNAGKADNLADHHSCAFGKWYDQNRDKYQNMAGYQDMYDTHKAFHAAAIEYNSTQNNEALSGMLALSSSMLFKFTRLIASFRAEIVNDDSYWQISA